MTKSGRGLNASPAGKDGMQKDQKKNKKVDEQTSKQDIQTIQTDNNVESVHSYYEEKIRLLEEKIKIQEVSYNSKLDAIYKVLAQKDDIIGKLNIQIGELRQSCDFLTKETSDIKLEHEETAKKLQSKIENNAKLVHEVKAKTVDLEDRSRRNNLVFYNFKESDNETPEDCEKYITELIDHLKILPENEELWIERAHRLGKKTPQCTERPRPIIAKFTYYKHKEEILRNGPKFRNVVVNVSQDYSRETIAEHKLLRDHGKKAAEVFKDPIKALIFTIK